ncbi:MAG: hypothetical protein V1644_00165 [Candidatus Micrarchaeota archaeon]
MPSRTLSNFLAALRADPSLGSHFSFEGVRKTNGVESVSALLYRTGTEVSRETAVAIRRLGYDIAFHGHCRFTSSKNLLEPNARWEVTFEKYRGRIRY